MACRGCLFVKVDEASGGDVDGCRKEGIINEFKAKYAENPKAMLFLNHASSRLDSVHCTEKFYEELGSFEDELKRAFDSFTQELENKIAWTAMNPISVLRRKFSIRVKTLPLAVSIHCRWKNCADPECVSRRRGRHCPRQKKNKRVA